MQAAADGASGNTPVAGSGVVSGVTAGTAGITYTLGTGCMVTTVVTVNPIPSAVMGASQVCAGSGTSVSDPTPFGEWSSSNPSIATIGSGTGNISGLLAGTTTITYLLSIGCMASEVFTVNPLPTPILGTATICGTATTPLSDATGTGTWSSSITVNATVGSSTGVVTGVTPGTTTITYTLATGCGAETTVVTVNAGVGSITGNTSVCGTSTTALTDLSGGGTWSSSMPSVATIGSTGIVTGVIPGTSIITYNVPSTSGCVATAVVTVSQVPAISGTFIVCGTSQTTLTVNSVGGTWSSSSSNLTINPTSGLVTGATPGTSTITYTTSGVGCSAMQTVTDNSTPVIGGTFIICGTSQTTLTASITGGTWSSSTSNLAINSTAGLVTGAIAGTSLITYNASGAGCTATQVVTDNALPVISGSPFIVCGVNTTTLTASITGGTWTSSTAHLTINSTTGLVTGVTAGTSLITYNASGVGCTAMQTATDNALPVISGSPFIVCGVNTTALTASITGGTWTSSTAHLAINSTTGLVTGATPGTSTITYTASGAGCTAMQTVTDNSTPVISGTFIVCGTSQTTLTASITGGTWTSSTSNLTINSTTGVVTGAIAGTSLITYTNPGVGCTATQTITDNALPVISGSPFIVCGVNTTTLTASITGGTWSSSTAHLTINSTTGLVTGATPGTSTITYNASGAGCTAMQTVTDNATPVIGGTFIVCGTSQTTLTASITGGTWSSSTSNLTINSTTGVVTGAIAGTSLITYTNPGIGCTATQVVTDNALPVISGSPFIVCGVNTTTLTASITGGTWTSSTAHLTINSTTGLVTGATPGTSTITYTASGAGCTAMQTVTDNSTPVIGGTFIVCGTSQTTLTASITGGTWTSNTSNLTINSTTGVVTGAIAGTSLITYTNPGVGCMATQTITDNALPVISGSPFIVCGVNTTTLTASITGGTWTSSTAHLTINSTTGLVTGATAGTSLITYNASGAGCMAMQTVTDNATPVIGGTFIVCGTTQTTLTTSVTGGTWSSTTAAVTIDPGYSAINRRIYRHEYYII